jgi:hypothetical protein
MDVKIIEKFEEELNRIETNECQACNYNMQSQKGHTCWSWYRSIVNENKYMFAYMALENLLKENQISHEEYEKLEQLIHEKNMENLNWFNL